MNNEQFKRLKYIVLGIAFLIVICTILLIGYNTNIQGICPIKEFIGFECPGCGGTRMAISILKCDLYQALRYNPFLFITLPIMTIIGITQSIKFVKTGDFSIWLDKLLIGYAISLLVFGIVRNIEIFDWLKPTTI